MMLTMQIKFKKHLRIVNQIIQISKTMGNDKNEN